MLIAFPELFQSTEALKKLEGPLLPFMMSSPSEQATFILKLLEKGRGGAPDQPGIARFESLLNQSGLEGGIDSLVKRTLFEHWAVRNVVAHRNGVADSKFIENCPWFGASDGTQLAVTPLHYKRYFIACLWFMAEVKRRLLVTYPQHSPANLEPAEEWEQLREEFLVTLKELSAAKSGAAASAV